MAFVGIEIFSDDLLVSLFLVVFGLSSQIAVPLVFVLIFRRWWGAIIPLCLAGVIIVIFFSNDFETLVNLTLALLVSICTIYYVVKKSAKKVVEGALFERWVKLAIIHSIIAVLALAVAMTI